MLKVFRTFTVCHLVKEFWEYMPISSCLQNHCHLFVSGLTAIFESCCALSKREGNRKTNGIDEEKALMPELAQSEVRNFLPHTNDGKAN